MNQKQKIEAQYLKLIGVTLMMAAACVSDSGHKKAFSFEDDSVREIFLEQFHFLSSGQLAEVIEWENAIRQAADSKESNNFSAKYIYFKVLNTHSSILSLVDSYGHSSFYEQELNHRYLSAQYEYGESDNVFYSENRNKYSLTTRAGPLA